MFDLNINILIVDDMEAIRLLFDQTLRELGYQNIESAAECGEAWLKLAVANPPFQLIFSDLDMPGPSGIDLLKRVRASDDYRNTPFILVTAEGQMSDVTIAVEAGVSGYILKPFTKKILQDKMAVIYQRMQKSKA